MLAPVQEVRRTIEEKGFCVLPGILDARELDEVRRAVDATIADNRRRGIDLFDSRVDENAQNVRLYNLPNYDPIFVELLRHPDVLPHVRAVLGETAIVSNFTGNIALPGSLSMRVHSDQALSAPEPWIEPWSLNAIWCLDDIRAENGATRYLPGSHRFSRAAELPQRPERLMRAFSAPAGSVILMEGRVWHTSGANVTRDERRAMLFGYYCRDFVRQQFNWEASLSEATKQRLDADARLLLGMGIVSNPQFGLDLIVKPGEDRSRGPEQPATAA